MILYERIEAKEDALSEWLLNAVEVVQYKHRADEREQREGRIGDELLPDLARLWNVFSRFELVPSLAALRPLRCRDRDRLAAAALHRECTPAATDLRGLHE